MSRRSKPAKRIPAPDPIYNSVDIAKFINRLMKKGKKSVAQRIFYTTMEQVQQKTKSEPIETFKKAITNASDKEMDKAIAASKKKLAKATCTPMMIK